MINNSLKIDNQNNFPRVSNFRKVDYFIDHLFNRKDLHEQIVEFTNSIEQQLYNEINCLECGKCCKELIINLENNDIGNLSSALNLQQNEIKKDYLEKFKYKDEYVFNSKPCPFLLENNICRVYEDRSKTCRIFPGLSLTNFDDLFNSLRQYVDFCPILSLLINKLEIQFFHQ